MAWGQVYCKNCKADRTPTGKLLKYKHGPMYHATVCSYCGHKVGGTGRWHGMSSEEIHEKRRSKNGN